jgi:hypothetical protein
MDDRVAAVLDAIDAEDWVHFKELVHPYVHWTEDGVTTRGRNNVIASLTGRPRPATSYELKAGQIYRWNS